MQGVSRMASSSGTVGGKNASSSGAVGRKDASDTFSIRLASAVPASQLQAWYEQAQPGESAVYASGIDLPRECEGVKLVAAWERAGLVQLNQRRDDGERRRWQFLVIRRADPKAPGAKPKRSAAEDIAQVQLRCLLDCLRAAADRDERCPSRSAMARAVTGQAHLKARNRVTYLLRRLSDAGKIAVVPGAPNRSPVVTILAKGRGFGKSTRSCSEVVAQTITKGESA